MKKMLWVSGIAALTLAFGAGLMAQTQTPQPSSSSRTSDAKDAVTLTGCLQSGDQALGTSGSSSANPSSATRSGSSSSENFVLANARKGTSPSSGASSAGSTPTGSTGSTPGASSMSGSSYILEGESSELKKHVGHEIEVTGSLDNSGAPSPAPAGSSASGSIQKLHVKSVKMLSASCPAK